MADNGIRLLFQPHMNALPQQVDVRDRAAAVGRIDEGFRLRAGAQQVLVCLLLVVQAAHQPSAGTRDFGGVKTEILRLCHFDRDGLEVVQKFTAAERATADAQAADHLCLVAHADLPQLDPCAENGGKALDQLAEIHAPVGGKEEEDLAAVKGVFRRNELHIQSAVVDLLQADLVGVLFLLTVFGVDFLILLGRQPQHGTQRGDDLLRRNGVVAARAASELWTARGFDDDLAAGMDL